MKILIALFYNMHILFLIYKHTDQGVGHKNSFWDIVISYNYISIIFGSCTKSTPIFNTELAGEIGDVPPEALTCFILYLVVLLDANYNYFSNYIIFLWYNYLLEILSPGKPIKNWAWKKVLQNVLRKEQKILFGSDLGYFWDTRS